MGKQFTFVAAIRHMHESLVTPSFIERHRMSDKDFTRKRKLNFAQLATIILKGAKRGIHTAITEALESNYTDVSSYSEAAFSKARRKINYTAFEELCQITAASFYETAVAERFYGFRIWAVDGSKINLPTTPETLEVFGSEPFQQGPRAQALCSCLYDVLNSVVLDAAIERVDGNERELAVRHIHALEKYCKDAGVDTKNELFVMDRGYPSEDLILQLMDSGFKFVMRTNKDNFWKEIRDAQGNDTEIYRGDIKLRVVRVALTNPELTESGKTETMATFITNLTTAEFSISEISELYRLRWKIETSYGFLKSRVELENFTGLLPLCLRQDFYAALLLSNLIACVKYDTDPDVKEYSQGKKYQYKVNYTETYRELRRDIFDLVLTNSASSYYRIYRRLRKNIRNSYTPIRKDRHPKRGKPRIGRRFQPNHKPS